MIKTKNKIKTGIIGASGFTGYELIKILLKHPYVELVVINSEHFAGKPVRQLYVDFKEDLKYTNYSIDEINKINLDVLFLALPHTQAMKYVPKFTCKIIDLSADYRFKNHQAVYGSPELFKKKIKNARIIANPGCYATGMILTGYPIQKLAKYIIYDAKSGWSGAGRKSIYAEDSTITKDNIIPYSLINHRHKYEVMQFIKTKLSFTPQVIDTFQGMMIVTHVLLKKKISGEKIKQIYTKFYRDSPFVKIVDEIPDLHAVQKTNQLLIGGFEVDENNQLVLVTVLDNLIKGASGQAVQNMNILFDWPETTGLR